MRSILLALTLAMPTLSLAVPVTYDFVGSGTLCTYIGSGGSSQCASQGYTGFVTIDVLAPGPDGSDSFTDDATAAQDFNGWVQSDFTIQWDSTIFNPAPIPGQTYSDSLARVLNNYTGTDQLRTREYYEAAGANYYTSYADLNRSTGDLSWLSSLAFDQSLGLAPDGVNSINFGSYTWVYNSSTSQYDFTGFAGGFELSSFIARTSTSVPEPGTFALLGLGLIGVVLSHRRRRSGNH